MKAILLTVLTFATLALANQVAIFGTHNKAGCGGWLFPSCTSSQVCLNCQDGLAACFPSSHSSSTCCGCSVVNNQCRACAYGSTCVRDSLDSTGYTCQYQMKVPDGAIAAIVIGGVVLIFVVVLTIACCVCRRRYATYEVVNVNMHSPPPHPAVVVTNTSFSHHHHHDANGY